MNIIAYGSLMKQSSLETTLGRPTPLSKIVLPGVQRVFNVPFDGYAFLNLQINRKSTIEAAYFSIDPNEINHFALREANSDLIEICPGYFAFTWRSSRTQNLPVLQSYIALCQFGADEMNLNFERGLIVPSIVFEDLQQPQYA